MGLNQYLQDLTEHAIKSQEVHVDLHNFLMPAARLCSAEQIKRVLSAGTSTCPHG